MRESTQLKKFGFVSKCLHWGIFVLVCANFFLIWQRESFLKDDPRSLEYILLHKSIGIVIFVLAILFIFWHLVRARPALNLSKPQRMATRSVHNLLFLLLIAMPLSGYVMSVTSNHPVSFFGLFQLPSLIGENKALSELAFQIHAACGWALIILVAMHVLAAFFHHFVSKDNVLRRMLPFGKVK